MFIGLPNNVPAANFPLQRVSRSVAAPLAVLVVVLAAGLVPALAAPDPVKLIGTAEYGGNDQAGAGRGPPVEAHVAAAVAVSGVACGEFMKSYNCFCTKTLSVFTSQTTLILFNVFSKTV